MENFRRPSLHSSEEAMECYLGNLDDLLKRYIAREAETRAFPYAYVPHIVEGIRNMIGELYGLCPGDRFSVAFLRNDLGQTLEEADDINVRCLILYRIFLYNCVSMHILREYREGK